VLELTDLTVCYNKAMIINSISLHVDQGELVSLVGPNGAGKSTVLRAVSGLVRWEKRIHRGEGSITIEGGVTFMGQRIDQTPAHAIARMGLILCPERRRPFREMSVLENLKAGGYTLTNKKDMERHLGQVYDLFPVLKERATQLSGTLSGGEQQMLAIGRALMADPKLLCIDEPSTGLSPLMRAEVFRKIKEIRTMGITVLLVEQEVSTIFKMTDRNYVLSSGKIVAEGTGETLSGDEMLRKTYLGL